MALRETDDPGTVPGVKVLVGEAKDRPVAALTKALDLQLDNRYPG